MVGYAFIIAHLFELIRQNSHGRSGAVLLAVVLIGASLAHKGTIAYREAKAFADYSQTNDAWFASITEHTGARDPIVIAFTNLAWDTTTTQAPLRLCYILSRRYDRDTLYCAPIPPKPTIEEAGACAYQADTRHHSRKLWSVDRLENKAAVKVVLIQNTQSIKPWYARGTSVPMENIILSEWEVVRPERIPPRGAPA